MDTRSLYSDAAENEQHRHDVTMKLSVVCVPCNGFGIIPDYDTEKFDTCDKCSGTGFRLTYLGRELLMFIKEFKKHPDMDSGDLGELPE